MAIANANSAIESGDDAEILGEFDDPPPDDEISDYPPGTQQQRESESVIDVEIVADEYTDAIMRDGSGTTTPDQDQNQPDKRTAPPFGPPGMGGPAGSGLITLEDAVSAQAAMRAREAARIRNMRRR